MDPNTPASNKTLSEAVDTVLKGMDNMFDEQKKIFANKDDLKTLATKEDLKREISFVRQDINDLRSEISTSPTRSEFNKFKSGSEPGHCIHPKDLF